MSLPLLFENRLSLPLIAAPMFLASGPELVIACCKAGIVGTFPAKNQRTAVGLDEDLLAHAQGQPLEPEAFVELWRTAQPTPSPLAPAEATPAPTAGPTEDTTSRPSRKAGEVLFTLCRKKVQWKNTCTPHLKNAATYFFP